MDLEQIGYFLFMEEQEKLATDNRSINENVFSWEDRPPQDAKED